MLQRRFQVPSYLLIPRTRFDEALSFLRQQRAINRSPLRGRNPVAYQNDFYRAIFAGARELGWDGEQIYRLATDKLGLQTAVVSLKALGPVQLKNWLEPSKTRCGRSEPATFRLGRRSETDPISVRGQVGHNRRPVRSPGVATSEAAPGAAAGSPGGGQRRRTAGERAERPQVSARVPHAPRVHEGTPIQQSAACLRGGRE